MNTTEILTIILLIPACVLSIALVFYLYQITKSLQLINIKLQEYSSKIHSMIQSVLELSEKSIHITNEVESQLQTTKSIVNDIRDHANKILNAETRIRDGIENAVMPIIKNVNAVGIGVGSFWRKYKAGKQKKVTL